MAEGISKRTFTDLTVPILVRSNVQNAKSVSDKLWEAQLKAQNKVPKSRSGKSNWKNWSTKKKDKLKEEQQEPVAEQHGPLEEPVAEQPRRPVKKLFLRKR